MGSNAEMTDYERRRLENIKRNEQMLAAFKIHSKLTDLTTTVADKRLRAQTKSYKRSPVKKPKLETPVVLRRSLRTRGVPPDAATAAVLSDDLDDEKKVKKTPSVQKDSPREPIPISMKDAYTGDDGLDCKLMEIVSRCFNGVKRRVGYGVPSDSIEILPENEGFETAKCRKRLQGSIDVESLQLKSENVARLVPGSIMNVRFFPTSDLLMVVAGNKYGDVGFWNVNAEEEDGGGIYLYHPHPAPISGIIINPFSIHKMYTSCYDGFIRMMDVEREIFDMVYASEYSVFSMSSGLHSTKTLYFGEGKGGINMWDVKAGRSLLSCDLHEGKITSIDFNSENEHMMATSSTDRTACVWDLRHMSTDKPTPLSTMSHKRIVQSAYFSPTGKFLATTSLDDKVGLFSGANYEIASMVYHYNQTGRWLSAFRGIWGWDDSSIYIGNLKRGVDIISVAGKKTVTTLQSDLMSAIPCRFDAHPCKMGMLAGATSGGQVYIWDQSS